MKTATASFLHATLTVLALTAWVCCVFAIFAALTPDQPPCAPPVVAFIHAGEAEPFWTVAFTVPVVGQRVQGPSWTGVVASVGPNVGGIVRVTLAGP